MPENKTEDVAQKEEPPKKDTNPLMVKCSGCGKMEIELPAKFNVREDRVLRFEFDTKTQVSMIETTNTRAFCALCTHALWPSPKKSGLLLS